MRATSTVGILEDDPVFREHISALISARATVEIVFAVELVADARQAFASLKPDLVLVDMQLPDGNGLMLIRDAASAGKASLMLTVLADRRTVLAAFAAGAQGYLLKDSSDDQILDGIAAALAGKSPISAEIAIYLLELVRTAPREAGAVLTDREVTILNMIARGLSYREAATAAKISVHTVGDHLKAIYRKLGVGSKSEAVHEARQLGWLNRFD